MESHSTYRSRIPASFYCLNNVAHSLPVYSLWVCDYMTRVLLTWPIHLRHHSTWLMPHYVVTISSPSFELLHLLPLFLPPSLSVLAGSLSLSQKQIVDTSLQHNATHIHSLLSLLFYCMFLIQAIQKTGAKHMVIEKWCTEIRMW